MSVRVRLTRVGSKKNAMWRVVVADQRSPRDGRFIEMIGHYNPQTQPSQIVIDRERLDHWLQRGAEPSNTVRKLMRAPSPDPGAAIAVAPPEPAATTAIDAEPRATESEPTAGTEVAPEPEAEAKAAAGAKSALATALAPDAEGDARAKTGDDEVPEPDSETG